MTDSNLLDGIACPRCGGDNVGIQVITWVRITSLGTADDGDHEWDDGSPAICRNAACLFQGQLREFRGEPPMKTILPRPYWRNTDALSVRDA